MVRYITSFALILLTACPAGAGPWLREKGKSFTSVSFATTSDLNSANSSYLEYGFRDNMTIGADVGIFRSPLKGQTGFTTIFVRRPLGKNDGKYRLAYDVGLGASWAGALVVPHIKTGLSWGRGFELRGKGGWMTVDASIRLDLGQSLNVAKIDSTIGLDLTDRFTGMLQLYVTSSAGDTFATLAPSVIYAPANGKFKIQVGAEIPTDSNANPALKIGLWREF